MTRLSSISSQTADRPSWSIAVFAHNEAGRIRSALDSIRRAADGRHIDVFVLANGCTDTTSDEVRACAHQLPNLWLVEIDVADKANAWNVYVHEIITPERAETIETHFFMDGDVTLEPEALVRLTSALTETPSAQAAGAMPATGRDRDAWRQRMVANGVLAGNLYALRGRFVDRLRQQQIRMPIGLIGEDFLVSWLVASELGARGPLDDRPQCVFHAGAQFSFRSLSLTRVADYRLYLRRKWRYARRALQHEMLVSLLTNEGLEAMPRDVDALYRRANAPSRLRWVGRDTPFRLLALLGIRSVQRRSRKGTT